MSRESDAAAFPLLDSIDAGGETVEVALLDRDGVIVRTNTAWDDFCLGNGGDLARSGVGISYLDACAGDGDDPAAAAVAAAIRMALRGDLPAPVSILVPCDSPTERRMFDVLISSRLDDSGACMGATVALSRGLIAEPPSGTRQETPTRQGALGWAPDPLPALLRVTEVVADEYALDQTFRRLAQSARDILGVSATAVVLSGPTGEIEQLGHAGIDARTLQGLGTHSAVLAWMDERAECRSYDVVLRGRLLATVYAAGDASEFTPRVERLLGEFAEAAGTAIDNARTHQVAQREHQWAEAAAELAQELAARDGVAPLEVVLRRAALVAGADLAVIVVPVDDDHVRLQAIVGGRADVGPGKLFDRDTSPAAEVMTSGKPLLLERRPPHIDTVSEREMGPVAVVPLTLERTVVGALVVSRVLDRPAFTPADVDALMRFCRYAGMALDLRHEVAASEQLHLHDDRNRIASALHDTVIRQLFAIGMGLEGLVDSLEDPELRSRVSGYVTDLDDSIRGIREAIFRMGDA